MHTPGPEQSRRSAGRQGWHKAVRKVMHKVVMSVCRTHPSDIRI